VCRENYVAEQIRFRRQRFEDRAYGGFDELHRCRSLAAERRDLGTLPRTTRRRYRERCDLTSQAYLRTPQTDTAITEQILHGAELAESNKLQGG